MKFKERIEGDVAVLLLGGKLMGGLETDILYDQLADLVAKGYKKFVIDFEGVKWINSPGIGVLIMWLRILRENDGDMVFSHPGKKIKRYLEITKLFTIIEAFDSHHDAVNSYLDPRSKYLTDKHGCPV